MHDVVFVGAGIANLYCAARYLEGRPDAKVVLLERSRRAGGRVAWARFCGVEVVTGAGVGRLGKDVLLLDLLEKLKVGYKVVDGKHRDASLALDFRRFQTDRGGGKRGETFREMGVRVLGGVANYEEFVRKTGYTDFDNVDAKVCVEHCGFDDLYEGNKIFVFSWRVLIGRLKAGLPISYGKKVTKIERHKDSTISVHVGENERYETRQVTLGVTHDVLRALLPDVPEYERIQGQPYIRVYAKLDRPLPVHGFTVVKGPIQKIIPVRGSIYMLAYADNASALELMTWSERRFEQELEALFGARYKIERFAKHFWGIGTHYYMPLPPGERFEVFLKRIRHPYKHVHVVGEVVADNQGWVGPALATTLDVRLQ